MKKIVALLLAIATLLALPACGKNTAQIQESTEIVLTEATDPQTEPHQHQYNITIILPSCTTDGYTTHSCACGDSYTDEVVPALGHSFGDWVTTLEPTETTTGLEERKCTTCNTADTHVLGVLIAGHVHSYEDVVKKPDCVNGGGDRPHRGSDQATDGKRWHLRRLCPQPNRSPAQRQLVPGEM